MIIIVPIGKMLCLAEPGIDFTDEWVRYLDSNNFYNRILAKYGNIDDITYEDCKEDLDEYLKEIVEKFNSDESKMSRLWLEEIIDYTMVDGRFRVFKDTPPDDIDTLKSIRPDLVRRNYTDLSCILIRMVVFDKSSPAVCLKYNSFCNILEVYNPIKKEFLLSEADEYYEDESEDE